MTRGRAATTIHSFRPGRSVRVVTHAVAVPTTSAVIVTAAVNASVAPNREASLPAGIEVLNPDVTTWTVRAIGGSRAGSSTTIAAVHHPGLCLRPRLVVTVSACGARTGPAVMA